MTQHKRHSLAVAKCEKCNLVHLIIEQNHQIIASIPLTRGEWAQLIGAYGDMIGDERYNPPN
jgi:hypothetical protein